MDEEAKVPCFCDHETARRFGVIKLAVTKFGAGYARPEYEPSPNVSARRELVHP